MQQKQKKRVKPVSDQLAPQDLDAEKAVLGGIMMDPSLYLQVVGIIEVDDFYLESHRKIYKAMGRVAQESGGEGIDLITLGSGLKKVGSSFKDVGGKGYVAAMIDGLPRYSNLEYYARQVKEASVKRRFIQLSTKAIEAAYEKAELSAVELLDRYHSQLQKLYNSGGSVKMENVGRSGVVEQHIEDMIQRVGITRDELKEKQAAYIPMKWRSMDSYGLPRQGITLVCARTSVGKSAFVNQIGLDAATAGYRVAYGTKEDSRHNVVRRYLSYLAKVDLHKLNKDIISETEWRRVEKASDKLMKLPISITTSISFSVDQLEAMLREEQRVNGLDLAILDYIQCFGNGDDTRSLARDLKLIMRRLADLAEELNIAFLVVAQLNRGAEGATPKIDHIKDSGIEEDAHGVWLLHRDRGDEEGKTKVIIAKNKNGSINTEGIDLFFKGQYQTFAEVYIDEH